MIYLGSDHGGFDLKEKIKNWLTEWEYSFEDLGNKVYDKEDDYPLYAFAVAEKVAKEEKNLPAGRQDGKVYPTPWKERPKGILCCRSAAGMVIAANKVKGARATTVFDLRSARHCRLHNDVNILALSGDWLEDYKVKEILKTWLTTEFSGEERHRRRLKQIEKFETKNK